MPRVSLPQLNKTLELDGSQSLMFHLLSQGIPVASSCRGDGICGKCKMNIVGLQELPQPSALELRTLTKAHAAPTERLSCQLVVNQPLQVRTTYW